jgi:hypothetical protein
MMAQEFVQLFFSKAVLYDVHFAIILKVKTPLQRKL